MLWLCVRACVQSLDELSLLSCFLGKCETAKQQLIFRPDRLIKDPLILWAGLGGGQSERVGVAGVALTPLHLLNTNFSLPVPAAVEKETSVLSLRHTTTRPLHSRAHTLTQSASLWTQKEDGGLSWLCRFRCRWPSFGKCPLLHFSTSPLSFPPSPSTLE